MATVAEVLKEHQRNAGLHWSACMHDRTCITVDGNRSSMRHTDLIKVLLAAVRLLRG